MDFVQKYHKIWRCRSIEFIRPITKRSRISTTVQEDTKHGVNENMLCLSNLKVHKGTYSVSVTFSSKWRCLAWFRLPLPKNGSLHSHVLQCQHYKENSRQQQGVNTKSNSNSNSTEGGHGRYQINRKRSRKYNNNATGRGPKGMDPEPSNMHLECANTVH